MSPRREAGRFWSPCPSFLGTRKAKTKDRGGTGNPLSRPLASYGSPISQAPRVLYLQLAPGFPGRGLSARKCWNGASIYLDSLPISIRGHVFYLLVPPFLLLPFKIKLEAAGESIKPLPNFPSASAMSGPELRGWSPGVRVSAGSGRWWAGAGMEPSSGAGGGRPLCHQGIGAAALAIQPPAARLRTRLRPDNQKKNNLNHEQRNRGPGKPRDFPRQGTSNQCVCKVMPAFITAVSTGLPEPERVGAAEAGALGSNPSSATE